MQAVLSGRAAVAFISDGATWHSIHYDELDRLVPRQPNEFDVLFQGVRDLDCIDDVTVDEIKDRLTDAVDSSEGLDLVLYLLDARLSDDTRDSAAQEFEELAGYPEIIEQIERILLAAPFPESADFGGGLAACERTQSHFTELLIDEWRCLQPSVESVFQAWHAIQLDRFGSLEARQQAHAVCLGQGLFRELSRAAHPSQLASVQFARSRDANLKRELPGIVGLLNDWLEPLRASITNFSGNETAEREWDEKDVGSKKRKQHYSFDRTAAADNVKRKKALIVEAMRAFDTPQAERLIDELVAFQTQYGGHSCTCQSLCDLAKQADDLSLHPLQLRLTTQAVDLVPDDGWSWTQHGKALLEMSRPHDALRAYDDALFFGADVVAKTGRAKVLKALGHHTEALTAYEQISREHPEDVFAKTGRAEVLKALGRPTEALAAYEQISREHPENVFAKNGRAEVLKALGRLTEALAAYEHISREHPEDVVVKNGRAEVLKALGRPIEALAAYEQISREHPEDVVAKTGRAEVLKALGRPTEALAAYEQILREHPDDVVAKNCRAEVLKALGRPTEALAAYEQISREHPDDVVAKTGRACVLVALKRWDEALCDLPQREPQTRNDWIASHIRGMVYLRRGQFAEAEAVMRRGIEDCPFADCQPFFSSGMSLVRLRQGNLAEARLAAEKVSEPGLKGPVDALLTEINGRDQKYDEAAERFAELPDPCNNLTLAETFAELKRRFVDRLPAKYDDDWLFDRQIAYMLSV